MCRITLCIFNRLWYSLLNTSIRKYYYEVSWYTVSWVESSRYHVRSVSSSLLEDAIRTLFFVPSLYPHLVIIRHSTRVPIWFETLNFVTTHIDFFFFHSSPIIYPSTYSLPHDLRITQIRLIILCSRNFMRTNSVSLIKIYLIMIYESRLFFCFCIFCCVTNDSTKTKNKSNWFLIIRIIIWLTRSIFNILITSSTLLMSFTSHVFSLYEYFHWNRVVTCSLKSFDSQKSWDVQKWHSAYLDWSPSYFSDIAFSDIWIDGISSFCILQCDERISYADPSSTHQLQAWSISKELKVFIRTLFSHYIRDSERVTSYPRSFCLLLSLDFISDFCTFPFHYRYLCFNCHVILFMIFFTSWQRSIIV